MFALLSVDAKPIVKSRSGGYVTVEPGWPVIIESAVQLRCVYVR